jgi:hypothetical protein
MKINVGQTVTLLANIAVLGGLIFVGLQLRQERQIALADGVDVAAARAVAWVQAIADNADVWRMGLSGEPLSASDTLVFDAMVAAWEFNDYTAWNRANLTVSEQDSVRFAREAAFDLYENPGLLRTWEERRQRARYTGAAGAVREDDPDAPVWEAVVRRELEALQKGGVPR